MKRLEVSVLFVLALLASSIGMRGVSADIAPSTCAFVVETGHNIHGVFLSFYNSHNGPENFGSPVTEAFLENGLVVQYFQRARFEFRPDFPEPYRVQLGLLGLQYGITDPPVQSSVIPRPDDPNYAYFPATGLWVPYAMKRFFDAHGGWELFGYPISNIRYETKYFTQYFQRARLEWSPLENRVVSSPVGQVFLDKNYPADFKWRTKSAPDWCPSMNTGVNSGDLMPPTTRTIAVIPTSVPMGTAINVLVRVRYRQTGSSGPQYVDVAVADQNSKPIPGLALIAVVHFANGDRVFPLLATDVTGHAAFSFEIGSQPQNTTTVIDVTATSGAISAVGRDSFSR